VPGSPSARLPPGGVCIAAPFDMARVAFCMHLGPPQPIVPSEVTEWVLPGLQGLTILRCRATVVIRAPLVNGYGGNAPGGHGSVGTPHHHLHIALIRPILGELTSHSYVNPHPHRKAEGNSPRWWIFL